MDDTEFDNTLKKISEQITQINKSNNIKITPNTESLSLQSINNTSGLTNLRKFNLQNPLVFYGIGPAILLVLFAVWKPYFVMCDVSTDGDLNRELPEKRISYKKLFMAVILFSAVLYILLHLGKRRFFPSR